MISRTLLCREYVENKNSIALIANKLGCNPSKVQYWLKKYRIQARSISDGMLTRSSPGFETFKIRQPSSDLEYMMLGLGLGLYWGEGGKTRANTLKIGNTDIRLLRSFMSFSRRFMQIPEDRYRYWLQLYAGMDVESSARYWAKGLSVDRKLIKSFAVARRGGGSYKRKAYYGVMHIEVNSTPHRRALMGLVDKIANMDYDNPAFYEEGVANVAQLVEHPHGKHNARRASDCSANPE